MAGWFDESMVGRLYARNGDGAWKLTSYCAQPTVKLKNLETGEVVECSINSMIAFEFDNYHLLSEEKNKVTGE